MQLWKVKSNPGKEYLFGQNEASCCNNLQIQRYYPGHYQIRKD